VIKLIVPVVFLSFSVSARAQGVSSGTVSLARALDAARGGNPEIRAALKRWDAARKRVAAEATPDKPRLDIERMYAPSGKTPLNGADEKAVSITQEFPFPTTLYLRGSRASKACAIMRSAASASGTGPPVPNTTRRRSWQKLPLSWRAPGRRAMGLD
jgi:outer membrane protein TolC